MNNNQLFSSAALPGALPISSAKSGVTYSIFGLPVIGAAAAVAPVANQIVYTPIFVPFKIKVAALGAFFSSQPSFAARAALYAVGSDGLPGSLIFDFGQFTNSGTISAVTASGPILTRGWYYIAINVNSTSYSIYGYAPGNVPSLLAAGLLPIVADSTAGAPTGSGPNLLNAVAQTFGAFPSTAPAPTTSFASLQIAQMQAA